MPKVKIVSRKKLIKEVIAAVSVALLLGGIVAAPAATVLTLYFPEVDLMPISYGESYNFTRVWIVLPGQMNWIGIYLGYGESMVGVYTSNLRINAYVMDVFNFFHYLQGATFFTPIMKGQPSEFSLFGYTAAIPGYYYLVVENYSPYPALVVVDGQKVSTAVIPVTSFKHNLSQLLLKIALIGASIGFLMYLPIRILKFRQSKKEIKRKETKKSQNRK